MLTVYDVTRVLDYNTTIQIEHENFPPDRRILHVGLPGEMPADVRRFVRPLRVVQMAISRGGLYIKVADRKERRKKHA